MGKADHMDYRAKAASSVDAFLQNTLWDNAASVPTRYSGET
jgi:hypothetical protein